ncbi:protein IQ-DOMAIN 31-like isoform X2 [Prosopis cineraria]|nr:protein IQ-DOMAIN 31-like isoform X2 [Prosopis cineraria]XP_054806739.1 protein IQ-DOMAIN 31-like isoform X2 [Prosopis cineraria]XP_054806741.1 protein IQ-DOMAIN 31-like isoform X2 [Prosopis cineraria]
MGKSPGKWIKTVLFGKKSSKSNFLKEREKLAKQKEAPVGSKASETALSFDPNPDTFARSERDPELENLSLQNQVDIAGPDHQDAPPDPQKIMQKEAATKMQATLPSYPEKIKKDETAMTMQATLRPDLEKIKEEEAAMKVQAIFRGYLARRAFRTLKGIIRLQALVRGHLVRRQAIATLYCMYGIIKLQALVRGRRVRQSDVGFEVQEKCNLVKPLVDKRGNSVGTTTKISANSFIRKLLASSTAATSLHLQNASGDPNLILSWLERWSASHFWKPVPKPKKPLDSKSQGKLGNISNGDAQMSKAKRSNWKIPSTSSDLVSVQENSDFEKPKRNLRKVSSKPTDPAQENSENEFEKVKRNLRKVHNPVVENAVQSEVESETVGQHLEKAAITSGSGVSEEGVKSSYEKKTKDATLAMSKVPDGEITLRISVSKGAPDVPSTQVPTDAVHLREITSRCKSISSEEATEELKDPREGFTDENSPLTNRHLSLNEDSSRNENKKPSQKSPTLSKQELLEDGLKNGPNPTLPSYMAATESAKAKLRVQGSPRFGQDGSERNNITRRHSLPSSNNSKISSHSPRTQRPAQAEDKGGRRSDRTMGSSRGGNGKLTQAEWRR